MALLAELASSQKSFNIKTYENQTKMNQTQTVQTQLIGSLKDISYEGERLGHKLGGKPTNQVKEFKPKLVWTNVLAFALLHVLGFEALKVTFNEWPVRTLLWTFLVANLGMLGVTGGMHRLWSHKAYKAKLPLRVFLAMCASIAGQNSILIWARDHRLHHKHTETDADPHNVHRGLFFSHIGWLLQTKHPEIKEKGSKISLADLHEDGVVMFQYYYFYHLFIVLGIAIPVLVPVAFWSESLYTSFLISFVLRYLANLHTSWIINSVAHYWGFRPYDEHIEAREQPYILLGALGEGFHNYHHTFPQDYRASEFGQYLNLTTAFIDATAKIGLAYDLKRPSDSVIRNRTLRTGQADCNNIMKAFAH